MCMCVCVCTWAVPESWSDNAPGVRVWKCWRWKIGRHVERGGSGLGGGGNVEARKFASYVVAGFSVSLFIGKLFT